MTGILMSYIATSVATAPIVIPPVGYKYWRINNIRVTTGYLEISEIQFFSDSTKINGIMTSSVAPSFGTLDSLNDGLLNNRCYWTENTVETSSFWIQMEFASTQNINGIKFGGWDEPLRYPTEFSLQYSQNGVSWTTLVSATGLTYPGNYTLSPMITFGTPDPYYSNVTLLLHMDGSNGSTTFTDSSNVLQTITANGSAAISTAQSKFGGSSARFFPGGVDYLTISDSNAIELGSADFTIECWVYFTTGNTVDFTLFQKFGSYELKMDSTRWVWQVNSTSNVFVSPFSNDPAPNVWYHIALVRNSSLTTLFINGVSSFTGTSVNCNDNTNSLRIANGSSQFAGYIDEFRITKGVARYTANFTPPTQSFPNG